MTADLRAQLRRAPKTPPNLLLFPVARTIQPAVGKDWEALTPGYLLGRPPAPSPSNHPAWFSAGMNQHLAKARDVESVEHVVEHYVPRYVELHQWLSVREFVQQAVLDSEPPSGDEARRRITIVGQFVAWAHRTAGIALTREAIFHLDVIAEWVDQETEQYTPKVRKMNRARLKSIAAKINPEFPDLPNESAYNSAWNPEPYTEQEITEIVGWAEGQTTAPRRNKAKVLLALTLGAGLYVHEVAALRISDIEIDDQGVLLHVRGEHARTVPVVAEWEPILRELVASVRPVDAKAYAFAPGRTNARPNLVTRFVQSTNKNEGVNPLPRRLRATWIVTHIQNGVPPVAIARAAGMVNLRSFDKWLYNFREFEDAEYREALRDELRQLKRHLTATKRLRAVQDTAGQA